MHSLTTFANSCHFCSCFLRLYSGLLVSLIHSYLPYSFFSFFLWHFTKTTLLELSITSPVFAIYKYLPRVNKDHLLVLLHICSMYLLKGLPITVFITINISRENILCINKPVQQYINTERSSHSLPITSSASKVPLKSEK